MVVVLLGHLAPGTIATAAELEAVTCGERSVEGLIYDGDAGHLEELKALTSHTALTAKVDAWIASRPKGVDLLKRPVENSEPAYWHDAPSMKPGMHLILFAFKGDVRVPVSTIVQPDGIRVVAGEDRISVKFPTSDAPIDLGFDKIRKAKHASLATIIVNFNAEDACPFASQTMYFSVRNPFELRYGIAGFPVRVSLATVSLSFDPPITIAVAPVGILLGPRLNLSADLYLELGAAVHWVIRSPEGTSSESVVDQLAFGGYVNFSGYLIVVTSYLEDFDSPSDSGFRLMLGLGPEVASVFANK